MLKMRISKKLRVLVLIILGVVIILFLIIRLYSSSPKTPKELEVDINMDGLINTEDYDLIVQKMGQTCKGCAEDINQDGNINGEDILIALGALQEQK
jgi:hypothetical protein